MQAYESPDRWFASPSFRPPPSPRSSPNICRRSPNIRRRRPRTAMLINHSGRRRPTRRSSPPLWAAAARADELACTAGRRRRARGVERGRRSWQRGRHGKESSSLSSPVWPSGPRLNTPPLGRVDRERRPSGRRAC
jgi:hypothetical protein